MLKIKALLGGALALAAAIFYALFQREKAGRANDKLKAHEKKSEVETKANKAIYKGLKREQEVKHEEVDTSKRDHFNS